jgi:ATP-dependent helicase HrpB
VPLVLMEESWTGTDKILVLEPRRIAARAVADRMARTLGEEVGGRVGLRVRFGSKVSARTRVEVVTEGIFTRMILDDPALTGVAAVLFDEFHERSLDADLGLALALDAQAGLREDLRILVMSATLDGARVAKLLADAPLIESEGRAFPVTTRHVGRDAAARLEDEVARAVRRALGEETGSALVFLPGAAEIRRTADLLAATVKDPAVDIVQLFGALDRADQDRAIEPAPAGRRKVVLATSIAETSLTIEGVRIVVDSGLARVPRFEPDLGLTRLETVRVSRAAADQRRGRAGRTEPGVCYRLWDEAQEGAFPAYATPEILAADLSSFLLDCAAWGVGDPTSLAFLDPPPKPALSEARALLESLGALDADGRITGEGKLLRGLPLTPRLARMVVDASARGEGRLAAELALLVSERGLGGEDVHLGHRLDRLRTDRSRRAEDARRMAAGWLRRGERRAGRRLWTGARRRGAGARLSRPHRPRPRQGRRLRPRQRPRRLGRSRLAAGTRDLPGGGGDRRRRGAGADPLRGADQPRRDRGGLRVPHRDARGGDLRPGGGGAAGQALAPARGGQPRRADPADAGGRGERVRLAEGIAQLGIQRLPWTKAQLAVAPPRRLPAPGGRELSRPLGRGPRRTRERVAGPAHPGKAALSQIGADDARQGPRRSWCRGT